MKTDEIQGAPKELHHIVLLLDSDHKQHDGKVFKSYRGAKEWAREYMKPPFYDKVVIGCFAPFDGEEANIHLIETFGFKKDVTNVEQLQLFTSKQTLSI